MQSAKTFAKSTALTFIMLLSGWLLPLFGSSSAQAATVWQDVASSVTLDVSNPIRSRRSPDAVVNVTITNSSAAPLNAPLRLVLGEFTPADGSVSLQGASGTTEAGESYLDISSYVGAALAPGATTGTIALTILGGGPVNFSFVPRVEQAIEVPDIAVSITDPATLITVGSTPLQVSGTISPADATLTVNGAQVAHSNGQFNAAVALEEGSNTIVARAVGPNGGEVTDSIVVSMDLTPPYITVETPEDGQVVYTDTIVVSGLVNDIVRGTIADDQANVTVNGLAASVSNRSYLAENIPLQEGDNQIIISASDQVGNSATQTLSVRYEVPGAQRIELVSGQNQRAQIQNSVAAPLIAQLIGSDGNPVAGKNVVFRVIQGDGVVGVGTADESQAVLVTSDANGQAQTSFKLGSRAGNGNHRVRAKAVGFEGEVIFYASADPNPGDKISVIAGNNQRGAINQPLPEPFVVAVTDTGSNLIAGAQVQFDVVKGGGRFQDGTTTYTTTTDTDGRASVQLTLGSTAGLDQQQVTATLVGTEAKAGFTASALQAGDPGQTTITGVVLDNQDNPVPGVTIRVDGTTRQGVADAQGQFTITEVPVGPVHLLADGSTASVPGEWPTLSYNIVTVAGASNPLSAPIYMVKLNTERAQWVGAEDVEFVVPEIPGFKLNVKAGSVTFPDGSKEGLLSVTPVNANKIPMPPPNGMQPQLIVTIQPTGTKFDPPAALTLPNVDAYPPGAQVEMYSYDHDLEEFVTIGLGTVSADGKLVASNNGVGVIKAGWHCGSSPSGSGCANGCGYCYDCGENCSCDFVPKRTAQNQNPTDCQTTYCDGSSTPADEDPGECKKCVSGKPENDDTETPTSITDTQYDCQKPACQNGSAQQIPDDGDWPDPNDINGVCKKCQEGSPVTDTSKDFSQCGNGTPQQACYTCKDGKCGNQCNADPTTFTTTGKVGLLNDALGQIQSAVNNGLKKIGKGRISFSINMSLQGKAIEGRNCCDDCTVVPTADQAQNGFKYTKYDAGVTGGYSVTFGLSQQEKDKLVAREVFGDYRGTAGLTETPNITASYQASGGGNYTDNQDCPGTDCGLLEGKIAVNLAASAGAGARLGVEHYVESAACPPGYQKFRKSKNECWEGFVGFDFSAGTELSGNIIDLTGKYSFSPPGNTCSTATGLSCTVSAGKTDLTTHFKGGFVFGPLDWTINWPSTTNLWEGFSGNCS